MSWVKFDDRYLDHPKIVKAGADAAIVDHAGIACCSRFATDGFVEHEFLLNACVNVFPSRTRQKRVGAALASLLKHGRWHAPDHDCARCPQPPAGSYVVHDYLEYQPSAAEAQARRDARVEAGRRGGLASGEKRRQEPEANAQAFASARASDEAKQKRTPSRPVPSPLPTSHSVSTPSNGPRAEDESFEQVWMEVAELKFRNADNIHNATAWKRTVAAEARAAHADEVRRWFEAYDVTFSQLAAAVVDGVPASWNYQKRKEAG
jgi:hypothetical protein